MSIEKTIQRIAEDIECQSRRLALFVEMSEVFKEIEFPENTNVYFSRRLYDDSIYCEFSPGYQEKDSKDFRPLIHAIAQRFNATFTKSTSYDESSLVYKAEFHFNDRKFDLQISGVVPKTCSIVETVTDLTDEELEEARREALSNVRTQRIEKKIICH